MPDLQQIDITILAIPSFVILMLVESVVVARQRARAADKGDAAFRGYEVRDTAASLAMGLGNVLINLVMKAVSLTAAIGLAQFAPWQLDPYSVWTWIALLVATDFCYYWFHRFHHERLACACFAC